MRADVSPVKGCRVSLLRLEAKGDDRVEDGSGDEDGGVWGRGPGTFCCLVIGSGENRFKPLFRIFSFVLMNFERELTEEGLGAECVDQKD